ncbi:MAG: hypothetical protein HQL46_01665 [Gammaproteobacteria bacterium]|nr:hypothetical protein [Gammaproteobacteria bacterium]
MTKNDFKLNKNQIETAYQQIKRSISNHDWWENEKHRNKAIKKFKKLKLDSFYEKIKVDSQQYLTQFVSLIKKWCASCLDKKHWEKLRQEIEANINHQIKDKENSPNSIELSQEACQLLLHSSEQSGKSISDLIIENFKEIKTSNTENQALDFSTIDNTDFIAQKLSQHDIVNKNGQNTIEVWKLAGGQCQSISKATQKRCKRISPDLAITQQIINDICYEYAVCATHNKSNSELDAMYIKN